MTVGEKMNELKTKSLKFHIGGKFAVSSKVRLDSREDLSLAYFARRCISLSGYCG